MRTPWLLLIVAVFAIGCSKSSSSPAPASPTTEGAQVACTLECSGTVAKGYGATEAEARADVSQHVKENCKPEDGQYFIFCDPPR
jgi:hypothetical protein